MPTTIQFIRFIRNKYVIASAAFIIVMLFLDHNDIFVQIDRQRQLKELTASKDYYEQQIEQTKKNLSNLENNPEAIEKYAREKYLLKKDNEDVFVVVPKENQKNTTPKQ
ncbi:MAG: septum formation initiator family protein [Bacteroidetes bacterium]|nr:septum formation initiator family protein [Bacteroidota bacterium]